MKINLEKVERVFVILGVILGVFAFFWQVYDSLLAKTEQIRVETVYQIPKDDLPLTVNVEIINVGQRPVFVKNIYIMGKLPKESSRMVLINFEEDNVESLQIEPGSSRRYTREISIHEINSWFSDPRGIYLVVESPTKTLLNKDLKPCLNIALRSTTESREGAGNYADNFRLACTP